MVKAKRVQYAVVYKTDGTTQEITPVNGRKFDVHELQRAIGGGWLERLIPADKKCKQMYADEEGAMSPRLPLNPHTHSVCDMQVYQLNGYGTDWQVHGDIVAVLTRDAAQVVCPVTDVKTLVEADALAQEMFGPQAYAYDRADMRAGAWTAGWRPGCGTKQFYVGTGENLYGNGDTWQAAFEAATKMAAHHG